VTRNPAVEIASPVELQQLPTQHYKPPRSSSFEPKVKLAAVWAPARVLAAPQPVAEPTPTAATPVNDRELLPGKTVTVIPVTSGPSTGTDRTEELPADRGRTMVAHGGGGTSLRGITLTHSR
jgi:hypothetical protein